jgi:hypothetical protein
MIHVKPVEREILYLLVDATYFKAREGLHGDSYPITFHLGKLSTTISLFGWLGRIKGSRKR